jgi:alpha-1,3-rhamnosyl/mannosyltransferase
LVLAGYTGWESGALHRQIEIAQREGWLHYLGFVPAHVLPALYSGAKLFAFPSLYEGFGLPALEAMASGVPVICSNAATLPEVAGDAALFHSPQDVEHLTELLGKGLEDDEWRMSAMTRGLTRARSFSWERCTSDTLAVYRAVSGA